MRAHGGDIRLVRSTGEGSTFELELPEVGSQKTEVRNEKSDALAETV
jgi:signal transduction histidine kinase